MASPFLYCPTPPARLTSSQKGLSLFHTPAFASAHPSACNPYSFAFLSPVHAFIRLISKPSLTICSGPGAVLGILCCHFSVPTSVVSEPGEGDRLALIINCHDKALSRVYRMPSWKPFPMLLPLESLHEPLPCFCQSLLHSEDGPQPCLLPLPLCTPEGRAHVCFSSLYPQGQVQTLTCLLTD